MNKTFKDLNLNGLVLCGGQSSRMQQDKGFITYRGMPQYQVVFNLLSSYCNTVYISGREQVEYGNHSVITDDAAFVEIGPLAGLLSAYKKEQADWLIIAVDYPNFGEIDVEHLLDAYDTTYHATVYFDPDKQFFEPFLGIYKKEMLQFILEKGSTFQYSAQKILLQGMVKKVYPLHAETLLNINTKAAYEQYMNRIEK